MKKNLWYDGCIHSSIIQYYLRLFVYFAARDFRYTSWLQPNIKKVLSNNLTQNHKSQQLQLAVGSLWPGVMVPLGVLLVGRMDQNMNLKEKWVYIKNGYKSYIIHICKLDLALNNP